MRKLLHRGLFAATLLLTLAVVGCREDNVGPAEPLAAVYSTPVHDSEAIDVRNTITQHDQDTIKVSVQYAGILALNLHPGADLVGVNLNYDSDTLRYEVIVTRQGRYYLVVVNPITGQAEVDSTIDNAHYTFYIPISLLVVDIRDVMNYIRRLIPDGMVVECNIEQIENRPTFVIVSLDSQNRYVIVYIDAETGRERRITKYTCGDDDKHKNKKGRGHYRHGKGKGYGHYYHCNCECGDED